jgi:ATP-binding cassette subfamily G (WHITE) protein 2 (SNQ2)
VSLTEFAQPTYLLAKLILNIVSGLFIGVGPLTLLCICLTLFIFQFTFYKAKPSQQGTQNQLFVSMVPMVSTMTYTKYLVHLYGHYPLCATGQSTPGSLPGNAQRLRDQRALLQVLQLDRSSHVRLCFRGTMEYCWVVNVLPLLVCALACSVTCVRLIILRYWTVGFDTSRAGYTYLASFLLPVSVP